MGWVMSDQLMSLLQGRSEQNGGLLVSEPSRMPESPMLHEGSMCGSGVSPACHCVGPAAAVCPGEHLHTGPEVRYIACVASSA